MLLSANYMSDLHVEVIDHAGEVVQHGTIGTLDHMVLLARPFHHHLAANVIVEAARAITSHFEADNAFAALRLEAGAIGGGLSHPASAVRVRASFSFG